MPETGSRNDPFSAFNFLVEIEGVTVAGFSETSGLSTETDPIEYHTGAEDITVRKLPGLKKFANIVLKRGYTFQIARCSHAAQRRVPIPGHPGMTTRKGPPGSWRLKGIPQQGEKP